MRMTSAVMSAIRRILSLKRAKALGRDATGATAVEFAIVATPFLMFVLALIGCALYFFILNSVEKGMDQSSRLIRTGQATKTKMTVDQFKQKICAGAGQWVRCDQLQVFVSHYSDWASVQTQPCVDENKAIIKNTVPGSTLISVQAGSASDVVIVTACYKWNFTKAFPFLNLSNMSDGSMMLQTATAFRSEPYPTDS